MAPNARDEDDRSAEEAILSARLQRLGEKLDRQRAGAPSKNTSDSRTGPRFSGFGWAFRLSSEMVAGVLVGAVIGWSLDHWLGISPWGLIVFLLVGFAAGVLNVMRATGVGPAPGADIATPDGPRVPEAEHEEDRRGHGRSHPPV